MEVIEKRNLSIHDIKEATNVIAVEPVSGGNLEKVRKINLK